MDLNSEFIEYEHSSKRLATTTKQQELHFTTKFQVERFNYFLFQVISNIWRGREGWSTKQEVSNVVCAETLHVGLDFAAVLV